MFTFQIIGVGLVHGVLEAEAIRHWPHFGLRPETPTFDDNQASWAEATSSKDGI
jgi:hypothetical protein